MEKTWVALMVIGFVGLWNYLVVDWLVDGVIGLNRRLNPRSVEQPPLKYVVENQDRIKQWIKNFYWLGAIVILVMLLLN